MLILSTWAIGIIAGLGLILSGMTNPGKVIGFLDLAGEWDPSLAFVMMGAIATAFPAFRAAKHRPTSVLGRAMELPAKRTVDARLLVGSAIFGIGWGMAGYCPGPALVSLGTGQSG